METDYISIADLLKATPVEEGGQRIVYIEPSTEARDLQGESVMAKALVEAAPYFQRFGNLDIQHWSILGQARGEPNFRLHEIGQPLETRVDGGRVWVKGLIYAGDGNAAESANNFWDSITALRPPQRWYPSIGGQVLDRVSARDETGQPVKLVRKIRWNNIGFTRTPVNTAVPEVSTVPFGALAKAWTSDGINLAKALEAGYGTDSATLAGGAALRRQSLDDGVQDYWDFRDRLARDLKKGAVAQDAPALVARARDTYGVDHATAADWAKRFLDDVRDNSIKRKKQ